MNVHSYRRLIAIYIVVCMEIVSTVVCLLLWPLVQCLVYTIVNNDTCLWRLAEMEREKETDIETERELGSKIAVHSNI